MELKDWETQTETSVDLITTLDRLTQQLKEADHNYKLLQSQTKEAGAIYDQLERELVSTLKTVNKDEYAVKGVGRVKIMARTSVRTPKTPEDKQALVDYVTSKYGKEVADNMMSINSQTLNSFFKSELEASEDQAGFKIPGIEDPTISEYIRFLK